VNSQPFTEGHVVRIIIVDEVRVFRDTLAARLAGKRHFVIAGLAGFAMPEIALALENFPDAVLLNVSVAGGFEVLRGIRQLAPGIRVLGIGLRETEREVLRYAEAGIAGYVSVDAPLDELVARLIEVSRGEISLPAGVSGLLLRHLASLAEKQSDDGVTALTKREREVADLVAQDLSNKEIAARLSIEVRTVKNHVHSILDKLNIGSRRRVSAVIRARYH
jgi:DNA-binding NarL/FixJ family response regulator